MDYGDERIIETVDDQPHESVINIYNGGVVIGRLKHYSPRIKVADSKAETTEYIKWTDELRRLRSKGKLFLNKESPALLPAFIVQYPKTDVDGSYFIIKSWTEKL